MIAHLFKLRGVLFLAVLIIAAACEGILGTATPAATPTPVATATITTGPTPTPVTAQVLVDALRNLDDAESYRFGLSANMKMQASFLTIEIPFQLVGAVAQPDKMEANMSTTLLGATVESEIIVTDGTTYMQNPLSGAWETSPVGDAGILFTPSDFLPEVDDEIIVALLSSLPPLEATEIDGLPAYMLTTTVPASTFGDTFADANSTVTAAFWVSRDDLLLRRVTIEGEVPLAGDLADIGGSGISLQDATIDIAVVLQLTNFNETVVIEPPVISGTQPDPTAQSVAGITVQAADDFSFAPSQIEAAAGEIVVAFDNKGALPHTFTIEGTSVDMDASGGKSATEIVTLEAGSYTFFCAIPGHRGAGMEGSLTVS